jgi:hypothetical protein
MAKQYKAPIPKRAKGKGRPYQMQAMDLQGSFSQRVFEALQAAKGKHEMT